MSKNGKNSKSMNTRTTEYLGLGFPVQLIDAPVRKTNYGDALDINHDKLQDSVFKLLTVKKGEFSGAHVKFIRHYMELTQEKFADLLRVDRTSVAKWEAKDLEVTDMHDSVLMLLRLYMFRHMHGSISEREFQAVESAVRSHGLGEPIVIDAQRLAA